MSIFRIAIFANSPDHETSLIHQTLSAGGHHVQAFTSLTEYKHEGLTQHFDVLVVHAQLFGERELSSCRELYQIKGLPVLALAAQRNGISTEAVFAAGVSSYVVGETDYRRLSDIIEVCIGRFQQTVHLQQALANSEAKLNDRKLIERAKGILMQQRGFSEEEAYQHLRKAAMDQGKPMANLAQQVINVFALID